MVKKIPSDCRKREFGVYARRGIKKSKNLDMSALVEDGGIYKLKTATDLQFSRDLGWHITPTHSIELAA